MATHIASGTNISNLEGEFEPARAPVGSQNCTPKPASFGS
jgi:hypothetical protein